MAENKQIMIPELGIFRKNRGLQGSGKPHNLTGNRLIMFMIKQKSSFVNCLAFFMKMVSNYFTTMQKQKQT